MKPSWLGRVRGAGLMSPGGLLIRALVIGVVFLVCHALGWREHTTFLSGTAKSAETGFGVSTLLGVLYLVAYFGVVLVAPILVLAALFLAGARRLRERYWATTR